MLKRSVKLPRLGIEKAYENEDFEECAAQLEKTIL